MTADACPLDGSVRVEVDRDATSVVWRCPWCHTVSRETHDPTRAGLQEEWR